MSVDKAAFTAIKLYRDCLRLADYVSTQVRGGREAGGGGPPIRQAAAAHWRQHGAVPLVLARRPASPLLSPVVCVLMPCDKAGQPAQPPAAAETMY